MSDSTIEPVPEGPAARARLLRSTDAVLVASACALAAFCGPLVGRAPTAAAVTALGVGVVAAVAWRPFTGALLLLAATPLTAGLQRGDLIPVLRPIEAVIGLILAGVVTHGLVKLASGHRLAIRLTNVDWCVAALVLTGSVLPLLSMVARGRPVTGDDLLFASYIWKYAAVYGIVRLTVRTSRQVAYAIAVSLGATVVVALIAVLQVVDAPGVSGFLKTWYVEGEDVERASRGGSTLSSSFAVADVAVFSLAIAVGLARGRSRAMRVVLGGAALVLMLGIVAANQMSGVVGLVVGLVVVGIVTRRLGRMVIGGLLVTGAMVAALLPVVLQRAENTDPATGLPTSWTGRHGRLDNLQTFFWPDLFDDLEWISGVRLSPRVPSPGTGREWVWIESGYTWMLWTGGVVFLVCCLAFFVLGIRSVAPIARTRRDAVGAAALGALTALWVNLVLQATDVHLTLRGSADLTFALVALALVPYRPPMTMKAPLGTAIRPAHGIARRTRGPTRDG